MSFVDLIPVSVASGAISDFHCV